MSESVRFANVISALSDVMGMAETTGDLENRLDVADDIEEALAWYEMVAYFDLRIARHQHAAELMQSILTEVLVLNRSTCVCWHPTIRLEWPARPRNGGTQINCHGVRGARSPRRCECRYEAIGAMLALDGVVRGDLARHAPSSERGTPWQKALMSRKSGRRVSPGNRNGPTGGRAQRWQRAVPPTSTARRAGQIAPSVSDRNLSIHFRRLNMSK
ncbi:hypothetical protein N0B44_12075 [Roseibacterium beibuensis]|uniref:Uncharacterized protein n=1 Tax=[Roseibacterium] beibuensis TaxID=1193142 RepID=A0ABP9LIQ8_9RHOB|nr:hypothetical protein [Roseibacterium beibuensis]MCS6623652.1 hypothetical protein [Roseibacterium beibuensis]